MSCYIVIENDQGLRVADVPSGKSAADVATILQGVIVDFGPYKSYEDAYDAMMQIPDDEKERAKLRD